MLYLVATPIGNLQDITLRALSTLQACDLILCEDTRHSALLLKEFNIHRPLKSFHQFNEKERENEIIDLLKNGKEIALISDAGTPGICDPGEALVARCWQENIPVRSIPGACAWVVALSTCRFNKSSVQFLGFLAKQQKEKKHMLFQALTYSGTSIFYESPHRIQDTLSLIHTCAPKRNICLMRELTKMHEEQLEGTALQLLERLNQHPPLGEFVILMEGEQADYSHLKPEEHVGLLQQQYGLEKKEAIKLVAELHNLPKRDIYKQLL